MKMHTRSKNAPLRSIRPAARKRLSVAVENLESRTLMSATTLRIVAYNIEADIDNYTTPRPGMATVLEGIGAFPIDGVSQPIDVLALEETTSNSATVQPIVDDLNSFYGAGTYAQSPLQLTEVNGDPTTGNGPSALIYNTKTVKLLQSYAVPGTLSSTTGVYRQIGRYEMQPVGGSAASDFYMYVDHYKSGTGTTNATKRGEEAVVVRNDEATLASTARVIYSGDLNTNTDGEAIFTTLMGSGQGQAFDARDPNGGVGNVDQSLASLSEAATDFQYRDDYQMVTQNILTDSSGLELVAGSSQSFGNNGTVPVYGSVTASSNTALASLSNGSAVLQALSTASDHLPVIADYTDSTATALQQLTGTTIGTAGSYKNDGNTIAKATDGNLSTFFDAPTANGNWVGLDLGISGGIATEVKFASRSGLESRMNGGIFQASDSPTFATGVVNLYTIPSNANPSSTALTTATFTNTTAYRYYRYLSPSGSYGNISELQFLGTAGGLAAPVKLTGTTIGTSGSYKNDGNTIAKATDGNLTTFFDAANANGNWVGLDLGSSKTISEIAYAPRSGEASRMVGGEIQVSTSATFSSGVTTIFTIPATPVTGSLTTVTLSSPVTARYIRYLSPNGSYGNISEFQVFG